ncbi:efflux RND transporter periplasmic adaptor subunit [Kyrpidia spormannii]|uniref:Efflux transporter, RND family, MFP subunit n=2 Tax=Kyrpidia spormannii TaxID=2055160 RepID=A0ACA8ZFA4_9BACL|nr:efflux RND transporter periplasmic adaptor subunit [Kyrpidia spormannii]CAB3395512.1 Efflux transporter, RND family, MFP subunit [Kyrpidia spormannii]CAB3396187.1 Efflux transporter, RND family, MFP subunit [Kyrpidia spormannii]
MNGRRLAFFLAALALAGGSVAGCAAGNRAATTRQSRAIPVETTVVKQGTIGGTLTLAGQIQASTLTNVAPKQSGKVVQVLVQVGDMVKAGQPLIRLDTSDLESQLRQQQASLQVARAQLDKAKSDAQNSSSQASSALSQAQIALQDAQTTYNRTKSLFDAGAASQQELDQASTALQTKQAAYDAALQQYRTAAPGGDPMNQDSIKVAQAQVAQAEAAVANIQHQIDQMTVAAPVGGVVASRAVEVGEYASPGASAVTIAQTDPVKLTVQVPETAVNEVKPGMGVRVDVQSAGVTGLKGTLARISPVEDNTSKSYPADVEISNADGKLKPGMVAQVTLEGLPPVRGLVIPASAIVETADGPKVFTVVNNVAHQHLIQIGAVDSQHVQVVKGLNEGDVLVVAGQELLGEGAQVTVVQPGQAGGSGAAAGAGQSAGSGRGGGAGQNGGSAGGTRMAVQNGPGQTGRHGGAGQTGGQGPSGQPANGTKGGGAGTASGSGQ